MPKLEELSISFKELVIILGIALTTAGNWWHTSSQVDYEKERRAMMQAQVSKLEAKVELQKGQQDDLKLEFTKISTSLGHIQNSMARVERSFQIYISRESDGDGNQ